MKLIYLHQKDRQQIQTQKITPNELPLQVTQNQQKNKKRKIVVGACTISHRQRTPQTPQNEQTPKLNLQITL